MKQDKKQSNSKKDHRDAIANLYAVVPVNKRTTT